MKKIHATAARAEMVRVAPHATVWIEDRSDGDSSPRLTLSIISLPKEHRRTGEGTAAMAALTAYADAHGLRLSLTPDQCFGTPQGVLTAFYRAHGFRPHRDARVMDSMLRLPLDNPRPQPVGLQYRAKPTPH